MSAMFDFNQVVTRTGTLAELDWRNPHIYILVDVANAGQAERWSFEGRRRASFAAATSTNRRSKHLSARASRGSQPRPQRFAVGPDSTGNAERRHSRLGVPAELLSDAARNQVPAASPGEYSDVANGHADPRRARALQRRRGGAGSQW
jgi:hypothetical protein